MPMAARRVFTIAAALSGALAIPALAGPADPWPGRPTWRRSNSRPMRRSCARGPKR